MVGRYKQAPAPLDCAAVEASLTAYLKGGLALGTEEAMRAHLLLCEQCTQAVQEARALDAALYAEAPRRHDDVPAHFSQQVQEDVYRRMRRALLLQRTRDFTGYVATVVVSLLFLLTLALLLGPWLRYLATVEEMPVVADVVRPGRTGPAATAAALRPAPIVVALTTTPPARGAAPALPSEHQSPAAGARDLLEAAFAGDEARVRALLIATRLRAPRVWARLEACEGAVTADALRYSTVRYRTRFAGVRVYYDDDFAGEMKLLLRDDGYWYVQYLDYASFSRLGAGCLSLP